MTWFEGLPEGETDWDRLASVHPEPLAAMAGVYAAAFADCDPVLLELARLRVAALLGHPGELAGRSEAARAAGLSEDQIAALPSWPSSPLFSSAERACMALTEQFALDASGVTDQQVADVVAHLGDAGCYAFVEGVSAIETFQRACLTLGIRTLPAVDRLIAIGSDYNAASAAAPKEATR